MVRVVFSIAVTLLFAACDLVDFKGFIVPTGEVVDSRFEKSVEANGYRAVATISADESYRFYVCADPHTDENCENLHEFSSRLRGDSSACFGVVLGDCVHRQSAWPSYVEAIAYSADNHTFDYPIFSIVGNHDIYFSGWDSFYELLGPSVYWFDVECGDKRDLFIALDSASATLGGKQMRWLQRFLTAERAKYRHCVVLTHTNLFYTDNSQTGSSNMAMEETALLTDLFSRNRVTLCLQGHDHYRDDLTFGGVRYTIVGTIRDESDQPEYLVVRMSDEGAECEWTDVGH